MQLLVICATAQLHRKVLLFKGDQTTKLQLLGCLDCSLLALAFCRLSFWSVIQCIPPSKLNQALSIMKDCPGQGQTWDLLFFVYFLSQ